MKIRIRLSFLDLSLEASYLGLSNFNFNFYEILWIEISFEIFKELNV